MNKEKKPDNIIRRPLRAPLSFITVFFGLVLLYFLIHGIIFLKRPSVKAYNIGTPQSDNAGSLRTGLILRDETVIRADESGTVTYFVPEGERVQAGRLYAAVDPENDLTGKIQEAVGGREFPDASSQKAIQDSIRKAVRNYDAERFSTVGEIHSAVNEAVLESLITSDEIPFETMLENGKGFSLSRMETSGFCIYWQDGLEGKTAGELTKADFSADRTSCLFRKSGDTVEKGDFLMKCGTDNAFRLVFLLDDESDRNLSGRTSLTVRIGDDIEITGTFSTAVSSDGVPLGILSFQKYGSNFMDSRSVEFRILEHRVNGYRIPESAIVTKDYYVIEPEYLTKGGEDSTDGVLIRSGTSGLFIPVSVFRDINGEVCIFSDELQSGMVLMSTDEDKRSEPSEMILGIRKAVEGVYQINSGYCVYRPVNRIESSVDTAYVIIAADTYSGLKPLDRIVLNAADTAEDEIIYQ